MLQVVPTPNSLWAHTSKFDGCNIRTKLTEHIRAERVSVGVSASSNKQRILSVVQQDWENKGRKNRLKMIEIHVSAASNFHLIQLQSWGRDSPFHQHSCCLSLPRPKLGGCQFLMSCFCVFFTSFLQWKLKSRAIIAILLSQASSHSTSCSGDRGINFPVAFASCPAGAERTKISSN